MSRAHLGSIDLFIVIEQDGLVLLDLLAVHCWALWRKICDIKHSDGGPFVQPPLTQIDLRWAGYFLTDYRAS